MLALSVSRAEERLKISRNMLIVVCGRLYQAAALWLAVFAYELGFSGRPSDKV
jgi:hypothetical protein